MRPREDNWSNSECSVCFSDNDECDESSKNKCKQSEVCINTYGSYICMSENIPNTKPQTGNVYALTPQKGNEPCNNKFM